MMASPSELSLDCKPHSNSMVLKCANAGEQQQQQQQSHEHSQKLEEFLARLEEERLKIDAFKRELPLCMQLLTNAMEASRQQLHSYRANNNNNNNNNIQGGPTKPVLEEFIPLKHPIISSGMEGTDQKVGAAVNNISADKSNWMTSAQLWSQASDHHHHQGSKSSPVTSPRETDHHLGFKQANLDPNKQRNGGGGGAFLPFTKDHHRNNYSSSSPCPNQQANLRAAAALPDLALASSPDKEILLLENKKSGHAPETTDHHDLRRVGINVNNNDTPSSTTAHVILEQGKGAQAAADSHTNTTNNSTTTQTHRKARRCWSPDLHRRFVNALQMLGGSQVATPKQIRELMKVDGLTNDEVKSHLQKYRLHTRRPSPSPQAAAAAGPQLVVLGGIWVPPEYATAAAAAAAHGGAPAATLYGAHPTTHHVSPHYPVPQEFYPATAAVPPPHPQLHHQLHHHHHPGLHVYQPVSHTQSSPESDVGGTGDRSESIEDGKSESSSWKADSNGENGGERKALVLRPEDQGEESNGSEITLKF